MKKSIEGVEPLERRTMMAADLLTVARVTWNGQLVDAVKDEYVFRMPQTNAATATSPLDYQCVTPAVQAGWSLQPIGSGFFKLTAPGATTATVLNWSQTRRVQSIDVNRVATASKAPNDPLYTDGNNWAFPKISADKAWDTSTGAKTTIVAVLDSGVDYNNPDLAANMWKNPNEIPGDGRDNDNNGYTDDIYGINAIGGNTNPMDDYGHGTVCAGLIGAVGNNSAGLAGVNWSVQIMAVKVMDANGNVPLSAELTGIQYVLQQKIAGQNIAVVNCSFGRHAFIQQELDALNQLATIGISVVAAAGNDSNDNDINPTYPANYSITGLISVAASDQGDKLATFSNYGATSVDLTAPGVGILSTRSAQGRGPYAAYKGDPNYTVTNNGTVVNQAFVDGTSCSAALVSGAAGLLKSIKLAASPDQIKNAILGGVDPVAGLTGKVLTGGRLNVKNSADLILATTGATPVASFTTGQNLKFVEGNSGYTFADVKVSLDRPCDPGKSCAVWYETRPGGSAVSDVDFVSQSGYVTFSGSEMEKTIRLKIIGDRLPEPEEQFAVRLDATKSKGVTIGTSQANVSILDDDNTTAPVQPVPTNPGLVPRVSIGVKVDASGAPLPIREGAPATFTVSLDKTSDKIVTVKYRTNQPTLVPPNTALENVDYVPVMGTITFNPGERSKDFTVSILADRVADPNETFDVLLYEPTNADIAGAGTNGTGGVVTATITDVPYLPPAAPGFQITVTFPDNSLTSSQQAVFQQAANRWHEIIVGDLPNVVDPSTGQTIDDILISATAPAIDGVGGILGQAGPTDYRAGAKGLPYKGVMQFDSADVAAMQADGTFQSVILHEMAHVLGFGSVWSSFNLVQGLGTTDPIYVGTNALREYRNLFGVPTAVGVPVENTGGPGTAGGHWRETVFKTELMTGYAEPAGTTMPISRITVGQFQDLGYQVNYLKADAYAKPAIVARPASPPVGANVRPPRMLLAAPPSGSPAQTRLASVFAVPIETPQPSRNPARTAAPLRPSTVVAAVDAGLPAASMSSETSSVVRRVFAALGRG